MNIREEIKKCNGVINEEHRVILNVMRMLNEQCHLYEGLLYSYPPKSVITHFSSSTMFNGKVKDIYLEKGENGAFNVNIIVTNDKVERTILDMATYGYYLLNNYKENEEYRRMIFEPKHNIEATNDIYGKYNGVLYHTTESKYVDKITKNGLVPRATHMIGDYPDRIYFTYNKYIANTIPELKNYTGVEKEDDEYKLLTIELDKNDYPKKRFFYDNNMMDSVYTLENIPPRWIIAVQDVEKQDFE